MYCTKSMTQLLTKVENPQSLPKHKEFKLLKNTYI